MIILPIKKKWFDMILSGEKKEEYRDIKPFYDSRFKNLCGESVLVMFRNGYSKESRFFVAQTKINIGEGNPNWGAEEGKQYYVLKIGTILGGK